MYRLLFGLVFVVISSTIVTLANDQEQPESSPQTLGERTTPHANVTLTPSQIPSEVSSSAEVMTSPPGTQAQVHRVIDGDTLEVILDGEKQKVRLIGVNTPETVDPRRPVQCFGKEASNYAKQLLANQTVFLESDPSQGSTDKYHRLLRYVWLDAKTNVNEQLIADGYAYEYTYNSPYKYQSIFKAAQQEAQNAARGFWSPNACAQK